MKHVMQSQQGFTLIEVMIAIIILGVGLLALVTMQSTGIFGNATANQITASSNCAANQIERIMTLPYDHTDLQDTDNSGAAGLDDIGDAADGKADSSDCSYAVYWNVVEEEPMPNLKRVRIHVHRNERGQDKRVSMDYIKAKYF